MTVAELLTLENPASRIRLDLALVGATVPAAESFGTRGIRIVAKTSLDELQNWIKLLSEKVDRLKQSSKPQKSDIQGAESLPKDNSDFTPGSPPVDAHIIQSDSFIYDEYSTQEVSAKPISEDGAPPERRRTHDGRHCSGDGGRHGNDGMKLIEKMTWIDFKSLLHESVSDILPDRYEPDKLVEAAEHLRSEIGISSDAWGDACQTMGRQVVPYLILMIASKYRFDMVEKPGGYLRELISRYRRGKFNICTMIYGMQNMKYQD